MAAVAAFELSYHYSRILEGVLIREKSTRVLPFTVHTSVFLMFNRLTEGLINTVANWSTLNSCNVALRYLTKSSFEQINFRNNTGNSNYLIDPNIATSQLS